MGRTELRVIPIPVAGEIKAGDVLMEKLLESLSRNRLSLAEGDILVVKHKIVSKAEGRLVRLDTIRPSPQSRAWARRYKVDARVSELAIRESKTVIRRKNGILITQTRHGFICANSGVDVSNVDGGKNALLLPEDSDRSAARLLSGKLTRIPFVIIRGFRYQPGRGSSRDLLRPAAHDLFR